MQRSLIAAVDDGPRSYEVIRVAEHLAERLDLRLILATVVEGPRTYPFGPPEDMDQTRAQAQVAAGASLQQIAAAMDLPMETQLQVESGDVSTRLSMLADEEAADFVVAGSRGRGPIRAALFGSVTAGLIKHLRCPLVVVPRGAATEYVASAARPDVCVICAIDEGPIGERVLACADHLAGSLGARLHLVRPTPAIPGGPPAAVMGAPIPPREDVLREARHAEDFLEQAATRIQEAPSAEFSVEIGDAAKTLSDIAEGAAAQLLVLAAGSPWQRLTSSAGVPVVVVPGRDAA